MLRIVCVQIMSINGKYPGWQPKSLPAVPGLEGATTVVSQRVKHRERAQRQPASVPKAHV